MDPVGWFIAAYVTAALLSSSDEKKRKNRQVRGERLARERRQVREKLVAEERRLERERIKREEEYRLERERIKREEEYRLERERIKREEEGFEAKIKVFGWDKPVEQNNVQVSTKAVKNTSQLSSENKKLFDFLDKYYNLYLPYLQSYMTNPYKIKNEQEQKALNSQLRRVLGGKGFYEFEIDQFIINGSMATEEAIFNRR
jgi:hypothetical protein